MSPSPHFPSPSQLLAQRQTAVQGGTYVLSESGGALGGFTPASRLLTRPKLEDTPMISSQPTHGAHDGEKQPQNGNTKTTIPEKLRFTDGAAVAVKKPKAPRKRSISASRQNGLKQTSNDDAVIDALEQASSVKASRRKKRDDKTGALNGDPLNNRPRVRRSKEDTQTKIRRTKIVKPSTIEALEEILENKTTPTKRESSGISKLVGAGDVVDIHVTAESLGLERSVPRRRSWTPLSDCGGLAFVKERDPSDQNAHYDGISATTLPSGSHKSGTFLTSYGRERTAELAATTKPACRPNGEATTKRRKIEHIDIPGSLPPITKPLRRTKSPRKKAQTITEKATAEFRPEAAATSSLLPYLAVPLQIDGVPVAISNADHSVGEKPDWTISVRAKKPKAANVKSRKQIFVLLPPEKAMDATKDQDILFGTSSQLVRDESPSFLRDMQEAITASETSGDLSSDRQGIITKTLCSTENSVSQSMASKNLWAKAARDAQGDLLDVEVLDLIDTPKAQQSTKICASNIPNPRTHAAVKLLPKGNTWTVIEDVADRSIEETPISKIVSSEVDMSIQDTSHPMPRSVAEAALRTRTKSRSPAKKMKASSSDRDANQMPNYQAYTTNELSKAITGYGFKAIKSRDAMISQLQRCWEAKNRLALQSLPPNMNVPQLVPSMNAHPAAGGGMRNPTKRRGRPSKFDGVPTVDEVLAKNDDVTPTVLSSKPRGRPRKATLTSTCGSNIVEGQVSDLGPSVLKPTASKKATRKPKAVPKDEIEDPNPPPTPSPPRRRSPNLPPQALSLSAPSLSMNANKSVHNTIPSSAQPELFAKITQAITTYPPTHDPKNLSWYEKILLYDPIVLEDLAAWLNTEGLGRVSVDEELSPMV
ncbi:5'-flap endonuclease, partial [Lambiella insularis]|nr:5'-flap endonuclease [Lambiella insularis]